MCLKVYGEIVVIKESVKEHDQDHFWRPLLDNAIAHVQDNSQNFVQDSFTDPKKRVIKTKSTPKDLNKQFKNGKLFTWVRTWNLEMPNSSHEIAYFRWGLESSISLSHTNYWIDDEVNTYCSAHYQHKLHFEHITTYAQ